MPTVEQLKTLFPSDFGGRSIEAPRPIHQRETLVAGELKPWTGETTPVVSAICVRGEDGSLKQVELGSCPLGGRREADEALAGAVEAYNDGRGVWPTMSVNGRIACMQEFLRQMVARRAEIVDLIVWEIGKSCTDSAKEFDRTVDYVKSTIDALKELDNSNSRFIVVEGTIGQVRRTPLGVVLCMGPYNYPLNETFATL